MKNSDEMIKMAKDVFMFFANKIAQREGKDKFIIDDENKHVVKSVVAWFINDYEAMAECNIDPRKGIIIQGFPGSGKSMLFRIMKEIKGYRDSNREIMQICDMFRPVRFFTTNQISRMYMKDDKHGGGEQVIEHFSTQAVKKDDFNGKLLIHACFDDLGDEEMKNRYGNPKMVMKDIITERYDLFLSDGLISHFTTNLSAEKIEAMYGARVRSRLAHMCNLLQLGIDKSYTDRRKVA